MRWLNLSAISSLVDLGLENYFGYLRLNNLKRCSDKIELVVCVVVDELVDGYKVVVEFEVVEKIGSDKLLLIGQNG